MTLVGEKIFSGELAKWCSPKDLSNLTGDRLSIDAKSGIAGRDACHRAGILQSIDLNCVDRLQNFSSTVADENVSPLRQQCIASRRSDELKTLRAVDALNFTPELARNSMSSEVFKVDGTGEHAGDTLYMMELQRIDRLTKRSYEMELLIDEQRQRNEDLERQIRDRDLIIGVLRSENLQLLGERGRIIGTLQCDADHVAEAIAAKDRDIAALRCELDQSTSREEMERIFTEQCRQIERLQTELLQRDQTIEEQRAEIERMTEEVNAANESVSVCATEFERACAASSELRVELNESSKVLAFYREAVAQRDAELEEICVRQRSLVETLSAETIRSDSVIRDLHIRIAALGGDSESVLQFKEEVISCRPDSADGDGDCTSHLDWSNVQFA